VIELFFDFLHFDVCHLKLREADRSDRERRLPNQRRRNAQVVSVPRFPEIRLQRSRLVLEKRADDFGWALSGGEDDAAG
jgi:hypothetical protein